MEKRFSEGETKMNDKQKALQPLQTLGQEADSMEVKPLPCPFCGDEADKEAKESN